MLGLLVWAVYKLLWPLMLRQIEQNRDLLVKQLDEANRRIERSSQEFLVALKRRDEIMQSEFKRLHDHLDRGPRKSPRLDRRKP